MFGTNRVVKGVVIGAGVVGLLGAGVLIGDVTEGDVKESAEYQSVLRQVGDHELHEEYLIQLESELEVREAAVQAREDAVAAREVR